MKKNQSITSDTRITGSLNNSFHNPHKLAKQLIHSQNCEVEFLRQKNHQLKQQVQRLTTHIQQIEKNKLQLLQLNGKYVGIVNQYYRRGSSKQKQNKRDQNNYILKQLEKDHRNLVKHCLNMEIQIKNYTQEMDKFNEMKRHLLLVSHTNTKQLIDQIRSLAEQNRQLKKQNNKVSFQLEKSRTECNKLKRGKEQFQLKAQSQGGQLEKYKSFVNTIQQESIDKSNSYQAKIYDLQLKVQKLEEELRREQSYLQKTYEHKRRLEIAQVEHVHERDKLRHSLYSSKPKNKNNLSLFL